MSAPDSDYCEECGHHLNVHGPDGCTEIVTLTGVSDEGDDIGADVQCGCTAYTEEDE